MKKLIVITLVILTVVSCKQVYDNRTEMIGKISKHENQIDSIRRIRVATTDEMYELINDYQQFIETYVQDTLSPMFLYRIAESYIYIQQGINAIYNLKLIESKYPDFKNMGNVIFMIGFIYENIEKDYESSRQYYQRFLEKYPEHPLSNDTRILIENLGKTPEQMVQEFEQSRKSN